MRARRIPNWLLGALALVAFAVISSVSAATGGDGRWRLTVDLSSFHDGHIATFDEIVEIRDGHFNGGFRQGPTYVALTFWVAGDAVTGNMAVDAGSNWYPVTIDYEGPVVNGVFFRELVGPATYRLGNFRRERASRNVDVVMRLERQ